MAERNILAFHRGKADFLNPFGFPENRNLAESNNVPATRLDGVWVFSFGNIPITSIVGVDIAIETPLILGRVDQETLIDGPLDVTTDPTNGFSVRQTWIEESCVEDP